MESSNNLTGLGVKHRNVYAESDPLHLMDDLLHGRVQFQGVVPRVLESSRNALGDVSSRLVERMRRYSFDSKASKGLVMFFPKLSRV